MRPSDVRNIQNRTYIGPLVLGFPNSPPPGLSRPDSEFAIRMRSRFQSIGARPLCIPNINRPFLKEWQPTRYLIRTPPPPIPVRPRAPKKSNEKENWENWEIVQNSRNNRFPEIKTKQRNLETVQNFGENSSDGGKTENREIGKPPNYRK